MRKINFFKLHKMRGLVKDFRSPKWIYRKRRAGVIPIIWLGNEWLYGFGVDVKSGDLSDFGGGMEKRDRSMITTALREFSEESLGVFEPYGEIENLVYISDTRRWAGKEGMIVLDIFMPVEGNPEDYREEFWHRREQELTRRVIGHNPRLEMSDIRWLTYEQIFDPSYGVWSETRDFLRTNHPIGN